MTATWGNTTTTWGNTAAPAPQQEINQTEEEKVFGWDEAFTCEDGGGFVILEPGEYQFTVKNFERGYYNGSEKSKACPMAKLTLEVETPKGKARVTDSLFLKSSAKWQMDNFFRCIGVAKVGQPYTPNWNNIIGMTGMAKIKNREYNGKNYNDIEAYLFQE